MDREHVDVQLHIDVVGTFDALADKGMHVPHLVADADELSGVLASDLPTTAAIIEKQDHDTHDREPTQQSQTATGPRSPRERTRFRCLGLNHYA